MISQYDVKRYAEKHPDCWYTVDGDNNIVDKENGKIVCTLKEMTEYIRKEMHCDFESVYYCHGTLQDVIRCRECGTVIFSTEDEWGYDPKLCCPTCGGYKTHFEYWTADEIKSDKKKQDTIEWLEHMQQEQIEADKRYIARGNKYDHQIWKGSMKLSRKYRLFLDLECDNFPKTKLKGLKLIAHIATKDDDCGYIYNKGEIFIPLSIGAFKIWWRYKRKWRRKEKIDPCFQETR